MRKIDFALKVIRITEFSIKKLPYDLTSTAGLALVGRYFKRINLNVLVDPPFPVRAGISNSDILKSYLALQCLGKNDVDAVEDPRANPFFMLALGIGAVPSSPTLRQCLEINASDWFEQAARINQALLGLRIKGQAIVRISATVTGDFGNVTGAGLGC